MKDRLLVGVLGNQNSGKSHTWNTLFGRRVRTGTNLKRLYFNEYEYVEVFLISGSPEERRIYVEDIITIEKPHIVLCSMQYTPSVIETIKWFADNGYFLFIHWLNPGYSDKDKKEDHLNILKIIMEYDSLAGIRNGKTNAEERVQEMRDFIYGWAKHRGLLKIKWKRQK